MFIKRNNPKYMLFVTGAGFDKRKLAETYADVLNDKSILGLLPKNCKNPFLIWSLFPSNPSDLQILNLSNHLFSKKYRIKHIFSGLPYYQIYYIARISICFNDDRLFNIITQIYKKYINILKKGIENKCKNSFNETKYGPYFIDYLTLKDCELNLSMVNSKTIKIEKMDIVFKPKERQTEDFTRNIEEIRDEIIKNIPITPYGGIMMLSYIFYHINKQLNKKTKIYVKSKDNEENKLLLYIIQLASTPEHFELLTNKENILNGDITVKNLNISSKNKLIDKKEKCIEVPVNQMVALPYYNDATDLNFPKEYREIKNGYIFFLGGAEHNFAELYLSNYMRWHIRDPEKRKYVPLLMENWFDLIEKIEKFGSMLNSSAMMDSTGGLVKTINALVNVRSRPLATISAIPGSSFTEELNLSKDLKMYRVIGLSAPLTRMAIFYLIASIKKNYSDFLDKINRYIIYHLGYKSEENMGNAIKQWDAYDAFNNVDEWQKVFEFLHEKISP